MANIYFVGSEGSTLWAAGTLRKFIKLARDGLPPAEHSTKSAADLSHATRN